jgi:hypothetical protein
VSVYTHPPRPRRGAMDPDVAKREFRDGLIEAIDEDPRVRESILRLFAADRARKKPAPAPSARARRGGT